MNAPGKGMLKVTSILLIIFGAIDTFFSLIGVACAAACSSAINSATDILSEYGAAGVANLGTVSLVLTLIAALLGIAELVFGIMGMKKYADPSQASFFIMSGIVMCALFLVDIVVATILLSFPVMSVIGFVLPILYIVGGNMNKKAVSAPAA